jgi:spermidine/putrescine transport system ATP-binding protein
LNRGEYLREALLSLNNVTKYYGRNKVLDEVSLDIPRGAFVTLLGASGCGKTTTLRIIAGLEGVDEGSVSIGGADITSAPPEARPVNTVFQSYALFPHMNVYQNVAYGPKIRKTPKADINRLVGEMLELVEMTGFERRTPNQLSGGQRQRVAIARALINRPEAVLLDEPLGALDLRLRQHMREELKAIQRKTGTTFVYVTHDQDEALDMSDLMAVMNAGRIEQFGAPEEIYLRPKTLFAAEFVGERNRLLHNGERVYILRDRTRISGDPFDGWRLKASVSAVSSAGAVTKTRVRADGGQEAVVTEYNAARRFEPGSRVFIGWAEGDGIVL